jgi:hypothetical protein
MPEPEMYNLFGKEYEFGSPDFENYIKNYYGPDFYKELDDWRKGKAKVPPRSGVDYLLGGEAKPADARETQKLIDRYKVDIDAGKYKIPTPIPSPTPATDPALEDAKNVAGGDPGWLAGLLEWFR